jgi:hypothetical protein
MAWRRADSATTAWFGPDPTTAAWLGADLSGAARPMVTHHYGGGARGYER